MMRSLSGKPLGIFVALLYPAMMAILWSMTSHDYSSAHLIMKELWWVIAIIAGITYGLSVLTQTKIHFSNQISRQAWVLAIPIALTIIGGLQAIQGGGVVWPTVTSVFLGTLFVGIGEETAFRGIILNQLGKSMTATRAVAYSSLLFGVMHSVNVMKQSVSATIFQVILTSCIGLAFGWVYVTSGGNLILVIVMHWLYDGFLIAPGASSIGKNELGLYPALILFLLAITFTIINNRKYKGKTLAEIGLT